MGLWWGETPHSPSMTMLMWILSFKELKVKRGGDRGKELLMMLHLLRVRMLLPKEWTPTKMLLNTIMLIWIPVMNQKIILTPPVFPKKKKFYPPPFQKKKKKKKKKK